MYQKSTTLFQNKTSLYTIGQKKTKTPSGKPKGVRTAVQTSKSTAVTLFHDQKNYSNLQRYEEYLCLSRSVGIQADDVPSYIKQSEKSITHKCDVIFCLARILSHLCIISKELLFSLIYFSTHKNFF